MSMRGSRFKVCESPKPERRPSIEIHGVKRDFELVEDIADVCRNFFTHLRLSTFQFINS